MADEEVLIFLSYAHDDDMTMSSSEDEAGFVTFLDRKLELKLREPARAGRRSDRPQAHRGGICLTARSTRGCARLDCC